MSQRHKFSSSKLYVDVVNIKAIIFLHVDEKFTRFTKFLYVVSRNENCHDHFPWDAPFHVGDISRAVLSGDVDIRSKIIQSVFAAK